MVSFRALDQFPNLMLVFMSNPCEFARCVTVCVPVVGRLSSVGMEGVTSTGVAMSSSFAVLTVANAALRYFHGTHYFLFSLHFYSLQL